MARKFEKQVGIQVGGFEPLEKLPRPPADLQTTGKKRWREIGGLLVEKKALAKGDLLFLEQLCRLYDHQTQLDGEIAEMGQTVEDNRGNIKTNPLVAMRHKVTTQIKDMLAACAMSPTHHTQIRPLADKAEEEKQDARNILKAFTDARSA